MAESFLFADDLVEDKFQGVTEDEIKKELRAYREYCISHLSEIENEAIEEGSLLKVFSGSSRIEPTLLKQSAFYVDQHIIQDPLFPFTHEGGAMRSGPGNLNTPISGGSATVGGPHGP